MNNFAREKADMFRRRNSRKQLRRTVSGSGSRYDASPMDVLYSIIKEGDPTLEGSEKVRRSYRRASK